MKLTETDIRKLRESGRLLESEYVAQEGDIFVAINPSTNSKRILDISGILLEGNRKLLLD